MAVVSLISFSTVKVFAGSTSEKGEKGEKIKIIKLITIRECSNKNEKKPKIVTIERKHKKFKTLPLSDKPRSSFRKWKDSQNEISKSKESKDLRIQEWIKDAFKKIDPNEPIYYPHPFTFDN